MEYSIPQKYGGAFFALDFLKVLCLTKARVLDPTTEGDE
jgi:hypothetical protein